MRTRRRVTTSMIVWQTKEPYAYYHPIINPRSYYGYLVINTDHGGRFGYYQEWYPRFNFLAMQPEAFV